MSPQPSTGGGVALEPAIEQELAAFEAKVEAYLRGEVPDAEFKPFRLTQGVYGQRQQGRNQMVRIKIPFGGITSDQMDRVADLAEQYGSGIAHITTRQDFQVHFVQLENTPAFLRSLAEAGLTTREACGNGVRNVCADDAAGVNPAEPFDVTPYAQAVSAFLLRHVKAQNLPRKFKINFSSDATDPGQTAINDLGFIAKVQDANGRRERGFEARVGGGLGPAPTPAETLFEFIPVRDLLAVSEAVVRTFGRLGDRKNRNKARIKFVLRKLGIVELRKEIEMDLEAVRSEPPLKEAPDLERLEREYSETEEVASSSTGTPAGERHPADEKGYADWRSWNVLPQKQEGYYLVRVYIRLGDLDGPRLRRLAEIARRYAGGRVRLTNDQNATLRWVRREDLQDLYGALKAAGLAKANVLTIADVTSCPGTTTCQLGITSSKGAADVLTEHLEANAAKYLDVADVRIKLSGCPNACGQHHIASIGLYGCAKPGEDGHMSPQYNLYLGGGIEPAGAVMGRMVGKVPTRRIPEVVDTLIGLYRKGRQGDERFNAWARRAEMREVKAALDPLLEMPAFGKEPEFYQDWGEREEFKLSDMGPGECAV